MPVHFILLYYKLEAEKKFQTVEIPMCLGIRRTNSDIIFLQSKVTTGNLVGLYHSALFIISIMIDEKLHLDLFYYVCIIISTIIIMHLFFVQLFLNLFKIISESKYSLSSTIVKIRKSCWTVLVGHLPDINYGW